MCQISHPRSCPPDPHRVSDGSSPPRPELLRKNSGDQTHAAESSAVKPGMQMTPRKAALQDKLKIIQQKYRLLKQRKRLRKDTPRKKEKESVALKQNYLIDELFAFVSGPSVDFIATQICTRSCKARGARWSTMEHDGTRCL
ncbi:hypothetical protein LSAT2_007725 [Lamellibrachia satsuma]|nr:hypothetical protein LSAT2_007725 [Lamellibrachia satsuma]